jgi:hypothetical protein
MGLSAAVRFFEKVWRKGQNPLICLGPEGHGLKQGTISDGGKIKQFFDTDLRPFLPLFRQGEMPSNTAKN